MAEKLKRDGHEVTVIHAGKFRGIGISGKKTARRDAEALATALRLGFVPEVHPSSVRGETDADTKVCQELLSTDRRFQNFFRQRSRGLIANERERP